MKVKTKKSKKKLKVAVMWLGLLFRVLEVPGLKFLGAALGEFFLIVLWFS
jgi:hypothetical protein